MIKYYMDKDDGVVVAKFSIEGYDDRKTWATLLCKMVRGKFSNNLEIMTLAERHISEAVERLTTFYGKSKCSQNDVFDGNIGKALAKKRLIRKLHTVCANVLYDVSEHLDNIAEEAHFAHLDEIRVIQNLDKGIAKEVPTSHYADLTMSQKLKLNTLYVNLLDNLAVDFSNCETEDVLNLLRKFNEESFEDLYNCIEKSARMDKVNTLKALHIYMR